MGEARVRPALVGDVLMLATLQRAWWREAYADLLPAELLEVEPDHLAQAWQGPVAAGSALIAEEGTHPVGFAVVGAELEDGGVGRIDLLGVLPRWSRRGHGGRLLARCGELLRPAGARLGIWWAVETDPSIAAFLAAAGWAPTGHRRVLDTGEGTLAEIEYAGTLGQMLG